ncbi:MAG TPA: SusC/RagA family TonB-linked outer membrane protein [Longimicrobiales bacterium]|nr:SusC/RagA family TonB-linked outer membrane protein [Longimicrobiales bacterium]
MRQVRRSDQRRPEASGRGPSTQVAGRVGGMLLALLALAVSAVGPQALQAQQTISGVVVAEHNNRPLSGAQVTVPGTAANAITDAAGRFAMSGVGTGDVQVQVVMLGYRTATVTIAAGSTGVRISMTETAIALDEIVVTGTAGGQQRRAIGNSIASVDAEAITETAPIKSMQDLINGRAPGVVVMPGTGMVGSGSRIRIRGTSTFSLSSEPLIYVDGVRVNNETGSGINVQAFGSGVVSRLNDFDPDHIESIEILKGPAAATLYGTEAARGVINIITKKGSQGPPRFSMTIKQGMNRFDDYQGRLPVNYWMDGTTVREVTASRIEELSGQDLFRTGHTQGYSLNMSGGSEGIRYFVAGDFNNDRGVEVTNSQKMYSGRVNLQITPNDKFDVSLNTGYTQNETNLTCEAGCGGTMWTTVFSTPANLPEYRCTWAPGEGCDYWAGTRSGPPPIYHERTMQQAIDRFTGSVQLNFRPWDWFTNRLTMGADVTSEKNLELMPYLSSDTLRYFWGETTGNGYNYQDRRNQSFTTVDYVGTVDLDVASSITSSTSLGVQYYRRHVEFLGAQGNEFAGPGLVTIDAAATRPYAGSDYFDNNTLGFYLQEVIGFNDRLFLTGAVRVDNNSAFGSELDFVTYPKASLSWVLSEEPAVEGAIPSFLNTFKLRLAYGQSGTQPVAFSALRTFSPVTGPGGTPAVTPSSLGNADLGPERGEEFEAGFDAGLFDDRLGVEFTYYHTRTKDGILLRPIAPSTGYPGSRWENAGQILNTGIEAMLRASLIQNPGLGWDATFSIATNSGKVEKLAGGDTTIVTGSTQYKLGYAPNSWFRERVVSADWDATAGTTTNVMCDDGQGGVTPCYNEAGQVVAPRVYLGRTTPSLEGAVGSSLSFLNNSLTLTGLVDFKSGYKKTDNNLRARCQVFRTCIENMNPGDYDPRVIAQMQSSGGLRDFVINDASFVRLREVSLTYSLPTGIATRLGASGAMINLAARNLKIWTDYTGLDPEATFLDGSPGFLEQSTLPQLQQIVATINVRF